MAAGAHGEEKRKADRGKVNAKEAKRSTLTEHNLLISSDRLQRRKRTVETGCWRTAYVY